MYKEQHTIAEAYRELGQYKKANRIEECSQRTFVRESVDYSTGEVTRTKLGKHRCHSSLCPICLQAKANYERYIGYNILSELTKEYKVLSLTITMESVRLSEARKRITQLHTVFRKLRRDKHFISYLHGYASRIEWGAINEEGSINLHLHALLFVKGSILGRAWVSSLKLSDLVQQYADIDYYPQCSIHKVGNNNIQKTLNYIVKEQSIDNSFIKELDFQLKKTKLFSYGGVYKEYRNNFIKQQKQNNKLSNSTNDTLYNVKNDIIDNFVSFLN